MLAFNEHESIKISFYTLILYLLFALKNLLSAFIALLILLIQNLKRTTNVVVLCAVVRDDFHEKVCSNRMFLRHYICENRMRSFYETHIGCLALQRFRD